MSEARGPGRRTLLGALSLAGGVACFSIQDVVMKAVAGTYPVHEALAIRSMAAMPLLLVFAHLDMGLRSLLTPRMALMLLRGLVMLTCYTCYYLAIPALPLADCVALSFTGPLFIVALAGPFLGERVGLGRWLAVLTGFAGVLIIVRPTGGAVEPAALLPIMGAATYALGQLLARRFAGQEPTSVMAFYQNVVFLTGGLAMGAVLGDGLFAASAHPSMLFLLQPWSVPAWWDLALMLGMGCFAAAGVWLLTNAYRIAEANAVAPLEYTGLIWAIGWGYFLWGEVPGWETYVGVAVVLGAGLYVLRTGRQGQV